MDVTQKLKIVQRSRVDGKDTKLLLRIINNILKEPNNNNFHNLNLSRISQKLNKTSIDLLICAGFYKSSDESRLLFDEKQIDKVYTLKDALHATVKELMSDGFTEQQALMAIKQSLTEHDTQHRIKMIKKPTNDKISNVDWRAQVLNHMVSMGYDKTLSRKALDECDNDINRAIQYINDTELTEEISNNSFQSCYGSIQHCPSMYHLSNILQTYSKKHTPNCNKDIINILDHFNHLLFTHSSDDELEYIHNNINVYCNVKECDIMRRFHRRYQMANRLTDSNLNVNNVTEVNGVLYSDLLDKIHRYLVHCYDVGYRLTSAERKSLQETDDEKGITLNHQQLRRIMKERHNVYGHTRNTRKYAQMIQTKKNELNMYSFGQLFYYWPCFEHDTNADVIHPEGYAIKDWFIKPKYKSLKEELIHNDIARITIEQFDFEHKKALFKLDTQYCKEELTAKHKQRLQIMMNQHDKMPNWHCQTEKSGIIFGAPITARHLLSVIFYCNYDNLQFQFSATYRRKKLENNQFESDDDFKTRHCNFGWMGRYLDEAVNIFCSFSNSPVVVFYHGINNQMDLEGVYCGMYQPFSTSAQLGVALRFAENDGIVLEIKSNGSAYFKCQWISEHPSERERLFINSSNALIICDIKDLTTGTTSKVYIVAIQIIQQAIQGNAFLSDPAVMKQYSKMMNPLYSGLGDLLERLQTGSSYPDPKPIDQIFVSSALELLCKELDSHEPSNYHERMFHYVCVNTKFIMIDMELMNVAVCSIDKLRGTTSNGYQGFPFLKTYFCMEDIEMLNLQFISKVFPNVTSIKIDEMSVINDACIAYILRYISTNPGKFHVFLLSLNRYCDVNYQETLVSKYAPLFASIRWIILDNKWVKQKTVNVNVSLIPMNNSGVQIMNLSYLAKIAKQFALKHE